MHSYTFQRKRLAVLVVVMVAVLAVATGQGAGTGDLPGEISAARYGTIQAALDANPGQMVFVPGGNHVLTNPIVIRHAGSGLYGFGRLEQSDSNAPVVEVRGAADVRVLDLTLTRSAGKAEASAPALMARGSDGLVVRGLRVRENRAPAGAITLRDCARAEVSRCDIENYSTIAVDDRTASPLYGYAFNCIDGTGIAATGCKDLMIQGNRVRELRLRPTPEVKARYRLGDFVKRNPVKGTLLSQKTWDDGYVNNWHQGSAIVVTGPEQSARVRVLDNDIENAAQGIDIHADNVIITGNLVANAFIGMKAMHGSRHVVVANNQFIRNDLWAIGLMPGAAAHPAEPAREGKPARPANLDAGHIIANNIITDFGYGDSHWIWQAPRDNCTPVRFDNRQEPDDPPLRDVVVTGNQVYDTGRDEGAGDGKAAAPAPRYRWAVFISREPGGPTGLKFSNNLFHPGTEGISNIPLE